MTEMLAAMAHPATRLRLWMAACPATRLAQVTASEALAQLAQLVLPLSQALAVLGLVASTDIADAAVVTPSSHIANGDLRAQRLTM